MGWTAMDRASRRTCRRRAGALLAAASVVLVLASACSSSDGAIATGSTTTRSGRSTSTTATDAPVPTDRPIPAGTKDCGTTNALSGWPTTTISPPGAYACLVDALATGAPAQMSAIVAGDHPSGRRTTDGYDVPARRVTTWLVVGADEVHETVDRTDDGGTSTTRTCTGLSVPAVGSPPAAIGCS